MRPARRLLALLLPLAPLLAAGPASPQEPASWGAWVAYEHQVIDSDLPEWSDWTAWNAGILRPVGSSATLAVEWLRTRRFELQDDALVVDAYTDLGGGWYANLRGQWAGDASVLPDQDYRVELFGSVGDAWEPSLSFRRFIFEETIDLYGASIARYLPGWYLRVRAEVVDPWDEPGAFYGGAARRYLSRGDGFMELSGGAGREAVQVAAGPVIQTRASRALTFRVQSYFSDHLGFRAAWTINQLDALPRRMGGSVGGLIRW